MPYSVRAVRGTGFFVGNDGTFFTARHVFDDAPLAHDESFGIAFLGQDAITLYPAVVVAMSERFDIALGRVEGFLPPAVLKLARDDPSLNADLLTTEFSGVTSEQRDEGRVIDFTPNYQKGYSVSFKTGRFPGCDGANILELSFPALRGASGAPIIIDGPGFEVVGMILANLERHLLPAQVETIERTSGEPAETVRYFLPRAYAISWRQLQEFLDENAEP